MRALRIADWRLRIGAATIFRLAHALGVVGVPLTADALLMVNDPLLVAQRGRIAVLADKGHLPDIYEWRESAEAGGLMSYGADLASLYGQAAT